MLRPPGARGRGVSGFKNALCRDPIPDAYGYTPGQPPYELRCHRHRSHPGDHRVVFQDGGIREWASGDWESRLTRQPQERARG